MHIPFCESFWYHCGCNKLITKHHELGAEYLDVLAAEIELHVAALGRGQAVSQLHRGGGSPTFLSNDELERLMASLRCSFKLVAGAEVSIEIDPRTASIERVRRIATMGFNRLSFGIQDFDSDVQQAVHRVPSYESVRELIVEARALQFESINTDLIFGLSKQTPESFARTIAQVAELRPDRIALYSYAHLPRRLKSQRRILSADLPLPDHRIRMLGDAIGGFINSGYTSIGIDHFALPGDSLSAARRQGRLHRNFQGYSMQPDCDLIGLGVSSIGRMGATYSQNAKTLPEYYDAVRQGTFPVVRGLSLTRDDLERRAVIMALMCQGRVEFESIELAYLMKMREYFVAEIESLAPLAEAGLVDLSDSAIQVTANGWFFVRGVAMAFDRHLHSDQVTERFSRII